MFRDRNDAGVQLARRLYLFKDQDVVVVGLPRGGVPVAFEVAKSLGTSFDVILVRKLGVPFQPELALGAIGENDVRVINHDVLDMAHLSLAELAEVEEREKKELKRRALHYRALRPRVPLADRVVLVVDDGVATGSTAKAACQVVRAEGAARIVMAVPVAAPFWEQRLADSADELISLLTPPEFRSVGQFYGDFRQTSDEEVVSYLDRSTAWPTSTTQTQVNRTCG